MNTARVPLGILQRRILDIALGDTQRRGTTDTKSIAAQYGFPIGKTGIATVVRSLVDRGYMVKIAQDGNRNIYVASPHGK